MPRIVGVDIPAARPAWVALTRIFGIGPATAQTLLGELDIDTGTRAKDLTEDEVNRITSYIEQNLTVEGQLRRQLNQNITRLKDIGCYRGIRHRRGLPVRGQGTQSNARSRKGPKRTVAGKKSIKQMR